MDKTEERIPIVDVNGNIIGVTERLEAHNGSKILHPVVHLHVFNNKGELYLQKRPNWKEIQPNKWDTSVGGHVAWGEDIYTALQRETQEEIGVVSFRPQLIANYIYESPIEKELIYVFKTIYNNSITPNKTELTEGRFWPINEINKELGTGLFTPNFEHEYNIYIKCNQ